MLMMLALCLGIGPLQVKRKGDDADDVGPQSGNWAFAGEAQGR